jgi:hypothetical protein
MPPHPCGPCGRPEFEATARVAPYTGQGRDCATSMPVTGDDLVETLHATSPGRLGGCRKGRRGDVACNVSTPDKADVDE